MNLVPFPKLHYLVSSQTPLYAYNDVKLQPRRCVTILFFLSALSLELCHVVLLLLFFLYSLDQMFSDAFGADHQLIKCEPKREMYLACALMVRGGGVHLSDIRRNIDRCVCV